jgi:hypothetical protein
MLPADTVARNTTRRVTPGSKADVTTAADAATVRRATLIVVRRRIRTSVMRGA